MTHLSSFDRSAASQNFKQRFFPYLPTCSAHWDVHIVTGSVTKHFRHFVWSSLRPHYAMACMKETLMKRVYNILSDL